MRQTNGIIAAGTAAPDFTLRVTLNAFGSDKKAGHPGVPSADRSRVVVISRRCTTRSFKHLGRRRAGPARNHCVELLLSESGQPRHDGLKKLLPARPSCSGICTTSCLRTEPVEHTSDLSNRRRTLATRKRRCGMLRKRGLVQKGRNGFMGGIRSGGMAPDLLCQWRTARWRCDYTSPVSGIQTHPAADTGA